MHDLTSTGRTADDGYLRSRCIEGCRQKFDQVSIGAAIERGRTDANLERVTVQSNDFIALRARLQGDLKRQCIVLPGKPSQRTPSAEKSW
jgi:hypothetical protein